MDWLALAKVAVVVLWIAITVALAALVILETMIWWQNRQYERDD